MSKRNRQHYIPQFLLRRFASRTDSKRGASFIYQIRKSEAVKEISVRDAAVAFQFYGNAANGVERALGQAEERFGYVLRQLDSGASLNDHLEDIANFIWLHSVRTRALRDAMRAAFALLFEKVAADLTSDRARNAFEQFLETRLRDIAESALRQANPDISPEALQLMVGFVESKRHEIVQAYRQSGVIPSGLNFFGQLLRSPGFQKTMNERLKEAHSGSLIGMINKRTVPDVLKTAHLTIVDYPGDPLVLGDCCAFVVSNNGEAQPVTRDFPSMREMYLPISKGRALVALRSIGQPTLDAAAINSGSAICSRDALFAGRADRDTIALASHIGEQAEMVTPSYIDEIVDSFSWDDGLAQSLESKGEATKVIES